MFSQIKQGIKLLLATAIVITSMITVSAHADDSDELVSQELKLEMMSFRYNSLDGSVWEMCTVEKAAQTHDFIATCGKYKFTAHVLFRIWPASSGAPPDEKTYDLFVIVDRHEADGTLTTSIQNTEINVASGGKVNKITADVSFNSGNYMFQTRVDLTK